MASYLKHMTAGEGKGDTETRGHRGTLPMPMEGAGWIASKKG
jgi:hypothetical protein